MSAEQVDPLTDLTARVARLEEQVWHVLPNKVDAVAYGLGLVRGELHEFREETRATLGRHGEMLEEILRRLPE